MRFDEISRTTNRFEEPRRGVDSTKVPRVPILIFEFENINPDLNAIIKNYKNILAMKAC